MTHISKWRQQFSQRHFSSVELKTFLALALPTVISTGTDAVLGFGDRLFLSLYRSGEGEVYVNAGLVGGITAFLIMSFFIITAGYSTALVAQFLGAKKQDKCARVISQIVIFALLVYPFILLISLFIGRVYAQFGHSAQQLALETEYTRIVLIGAIVAILRSGLGGFFIGIQKTKVVMYANILGMLVNLPLNYMLIFGIGIFPEMGIAGAAWATVISGCIALGTLLAVYLGQKIHTQFHTRRRVIFDASLFGKLLRFGLPSGLEVMVAVGVFDFFILAMNAYGEAVGSAVTIAITWDSMFFIPMIGAGFTTTSLVGNAMGARNVAQAVRHAKVTLAVILGFAVLVAAFVLLFPQPLVGVFLSKMSNAAEVQPLAIFMLRFACLYMVFDGMHIAFASVLRGAGDTKVMMFIFVSISLFFAAVAFVFIFTQRVGPVVAWLMFVGFALTLGIGMFVRFAQGKWQSIVMVD